VPRCGDLFIIGGGLRPDNAAVIQRMIASAGGRERARFVLFPSAAKNLDPARQVGELLIRYGLSRDRVMVLDLMPENAARQAFDPDVVNHIRSATGAFLSGGDQFRITRALLRPDGTPTPALAALKEMWRRGGVIAGSSAGASVQSARMLDAAGLPDDLLDEGMDALDFGISRDVRRRGLLITAGLGFFSSGIVDQHFSQYRGRLARLARASIEDRVRFGFGVDENTAMIVSHDGQIEVAGNGNLTVVDVQSARCQDGPLGCRISAVRVSLLQTGDRFNPARGLMTIRPEKKPMQEGAQDFSGNHLIADMAGPGAIPWSMIFGLAENSSPRQEGITLRYNERFGHGYRFVLAKTDRTAIYGGYADHFFSYAIDGVRLDIAPIVSTRQDPQEVLPVDLPPGPERMVLESLWFRGILLANDRRRLRPLEPITRAEWATAIAQTVHLVAPRRNPPKVADAPLTADVVEAIVRVVAAGLMTLDGDGHICPDQPLKRGEAVESLARLAERCGLENPPFKPFSFADETEVPFANRAAVRRVVRTGLLSLNEERRLRPAASLTRLEAAEALYRVIGFAW
jgi:cyanophycinase